MPTMPAHLEPCGGLKMTWHVCVNSSSGMLEHAADTVLEATWPDMRRNTELLTAKSFFHRVFTGYKSAAVACNQPRSEPTAWRRAQVLCSLANRGRCGLLGPNPVASTLRLHDDDTAAYCSRTRHCRQHAHLRAGSLLQLSGVHSHGY